MEEQFRSFTDLIFLLYLMRHILHNFPELLETGTGGQREFIPSILRSAVSFGIEGIFMEVHPDPPNALSDATTQYPLSQIKSLLKEMIGLDRYIKKEILISRSSL